MITIMCVYKGQKNATLFFNLRVKSCLIVPSNTAAFLISLFSSPETGYVLNYIGPWGFFGEARGRFRVGTNSDLVSCLT